MGANASAPEASGKLDFLRNNQQFQRLRAMVQTNPQILERMLQEIGKQNPQLLRVIQEHPADFIRLIKEPLEGRENVLGQLASGTPLYTVPSPYPPPHAFPQQHPPPPPYHGGFPYPPDQQRQQPPRATHKYDHPAAYPGWLGAYYNAQGQQSGSFRRPPYMGFPEMGTNAPADAGGKFDFLRHDKQFQVLREMVQANPQILQPFLQDLGKLNPPLMKLIQEHLADFLRFINEPSPVEGGKNVLGQHASGMPQGLTVTPKEREDIKCLEAMGFNRAAVLEVFIACNKNKELATSYLLDHMHEPVKGGENVLGQLASGMPHAVMVKPEEREAIERLKAMGFGREVVLEVFFACNKNEESAANYLLDHMHELKN